MYLLTSDIHLTDRASDHYRFGLFDWLHKQAKTNSADAIFILGDLTVFKDHHSASLVNSMSEGLCQLTEICPVIILKGNHDFIDENNPYFRFLNNFPGIRFISEPSSLEFGDDKFVLLPYTKDINDWKPIKPTMKSANFIFMHQTVNGALSSNGYKLEGIKTSYFKSFDAAIYSGDIHVPQTVGKVTYVGSPYSINFSDDFEARSLLVWREDDGVFEEDLHFDCLRKWTLDITAPSDINKYRDDLRKGDQVKINMRLSREELTSWANYKAEALTICEKLGVNVYNVELIPSKKTSRVRLDDDEQPAETEVRSLKTPKKVILEFCKQENIPSPIRKAGLQLIG